MKEDKKKIIGRYIKSYNEFDVEGMVEGLAENIVFENIANESVTLRTEGIEEFVQQAKMATKYFKSRQQTVETWRFNDSNVIVEIAYKAILAIDLPNGLKKGDSLELKGISEFEFENQKIVRITDRS
ncbi:nuclear transport factor 2 family protein [uncultured Tenacibaculum sp.]|uniref:nuclear transport factor 2 family protein n=1 Tax=uncultured Tenacibaculum sp. TaxID=174713 RepID=UPI00260AEACE|nr:nuclear transport factor 2 family protein [uncultured Tenacibaculum sp.]